MGANRFPSFFVAGISLAISALLPSLCPAQENLDPMTGLPKEIAPGACADLTVLHRLPGTIIVSCDKQVSAEVTMPLNPDAQGYSREKTVRGAYEFREYQILDPIQQEQAFDNLSRLLGIAGFTIKFSSNLSTITGRNQDTWILVKVSGEYYDVSVVRAKEEPWTPVQNAQEISREMEAQKRVAIYGVTFSPDNQAISEKDSKILVEVLKYLKENPNLAVIVESHKFSATGNAEDDLVITRKRADSVVDWLVARGIVSGRLKSNGLGRTKPVTENDTEIEIQRNERIVLAKAAS